MNRLSIVVASAALLFSSLGLAAKPDPSKPPLTREAYAKLLVGLSECKVVGYEVDGKCPAVKALQEGIRETSAGMKELALLNEGLGRELLTHASPAVRIKAAQLTSTLLGTATSSQDAIVAAAATEKDVGVLQAYLRAVSSSGAKNPKVAALLLKSADHTDVKVRLQAVYAISSSWNREMAGGAEKLVVMAQKDADADVRRASCEHGGGLGNPVLLPFIEKTTATTDDKLMYSACMKGLLAMFHEYPLYGTSNEAAYNLFLKRMSDTPRSALRPPWTLTSAFDKYNSTTNKSLAEWKKAAPWFKPAEVIKVLGDVLKDRQVNWLGRKGAVGSLVALGATKAELEAINAALDPKHSDDKSVSAALVEAIAQLK